MIIVSSLLIRFATPSDAMRLAEVHVASWQAAYKGLLPDGPLAHLSVMRRAEFWQTELVAWPKQTLVGENNGRLLGFIHFGPSRDDDAHPLCGEIYGFYLLAESWSKGYGAALWQAAWAQLQQNGFTEVTLWVLQGNKRAITFYEKVGFAADKASKTEQWQTITLHELRYRRKIALKQNEGDATGDCSRR